MKYFAKTLLAILILLYCQQSIGEINCNTIETVDTSTISILRTSYEKKYTLLNVDSSIEKWKQTATIIFVVSLILTFCGGIITLLQAGNSRAIKILVAILGVCVLLLNEVRNNMPDGTYKTYHNAIREAKNIKIDLDSDFAATRSESLTPIIFKTAIASICENIKTLEILQKNYPTDIPFSFNFVNLADAAPTWWSDTTITGIRASGTGASRIEAKIAAEKQGLLEIQKQIESKIDSQLKEPIFSSLKKKIKDASMLAAQKELETFEDANPASYWILYQIDNSFINSILKGISFPLVIFKTDFLEPKIEALNKDLSAYGFNVTEQPAPRGANSETNAIFVGSGVPIDAIKKTVELLENSGIPIKAIIYPWTFQKSQLGEEQKFNLIQIGGTKMLESSPFFSKESLEILKTITSQDEMVSFCKEPTEALKKSWGIK